MNPAGASEFRIEVVDTGIGIQPRDLAALVALLTDLLGRRS